MPASGCDGVSSKTATDYYRQCRRAQGEGVRILGTNLPARRQQRAAREAGDGQGGATEGRSPRKGTGRRRCIVTRGDPRAGVALSSHLAAAAGDLRNRDGVAGPVQRRPWASRE
jgi:hypothetical protein